MKRNIVNKIIDDILIENDFRIMYAAEVGSRTYGLESKDSDHDIKFIFVRPHADYLQLFPKKDFYNINHRYVDGQGWDVFKFLKLLIKSNLSIYELFYSDT